MGRGAGLEQPAARAQATRAAGKERAMDVKSHASCANTTTLRKSCVAPHLRCNRGSNHQPLSLWSLRPAMEHRLESSIRSLTPEASPSLPLRLINTSRSGSLSAKHLAPASSAATEYPRWVTAGATQGI